MGIIFNKRLVFFFRICYYFCDVKAKLVNHIFDKRARKNKFCSLWGGSKQKTAKSCIECQWAFKKDQAMLLYQITWKKCHKKEKYLFSKTCDIILLLLSYFLFKGATNEVPIQWVFEKHAFSSKFMFVELIIWCSYFGSQEIQIHWPNLCHEI